MSPILIYINACYDCLYIFRNVELIYWLVTFMLKGLYAHISRFSHQFCLHQSPLTFAVGWDPRNFELNPMLCVFIRAVPGLNAASERRLTQGANTCLPWERFCCQFPSGKQFSLLSLYPYNCITYSTLVSSLFNVQISWMHLVKRKAQTVMKFSHHSDRFTSEMQ